MKSLRFHVLKVIFPILMTVASVTTVYAAPPEFFTFHDEGSFVIDCGSFLAQEDFVEDVRGAVFFDQAGNPIRVQIHIDFNGVLTDLNTGFTLLDPANYTATIDLEEGTRTEVGQIYRIIVPGEGIAVLDAGKLIFDADGNLTFVGGPHQQLFGGDALVCAALD